MSKPENARSKEEVYVNNIISKTHIHVNDDLSEGHARLHIPKRDVDFYDKVDLEDEVLSRIQEYIEIKTSESIMIVDYEYNKVRESYEFRFELNSQPDECPDCGTKSEDDHGDMCPQVM